METVQINEYDYTQVETENLVLTGSHDTIATLTKEQALEVAQQLLQAIADKDSDRVRMFFEMKEPTSRNELPTLSFGFGHCGWVAPKLHWAIIQGYLIHSLHHDEEA